MLNTMWTGEELICVKEEANDTDQSPNSPDLSYQTDSQDGSLEFHRLSPPHHEYFYADPSGSPISIDPNYLTSLSLPPFQTIPPTCPSLISTVTISELTASQLVQLSQCPTSNSPNMGLTMGSEVSMTMTREGRKRSNSGSSGSSDSAGSCSSRPKRRRLPVSTEEMMLQRNQANVRERERTRSLNDAFSKLREIVPTLPSDKLSKIQTLKLASKYIDFLNNVLEDGDTSFDLSQSPNANSLSCFALRDDLSHAFNLWRMGRCSDPQRDS